jgi:spore coat protein A
MSKNDDKTSGRNLSRRRFLQTAAIAGAAMSAPSILTSRKASAAPPLTVKDPRFSVPVIDPRSIPQFVDALPVPGANWPVIGAGSEIMKIVQRNVQILPSTLAVPLTAVWCYRGTAEYGSTFLGPTMLAHTGTPATVTYDYTGVPLAGGYLLKDGLNAVSVQDLHVHGTDASEPQIRFIAHLHGMDGVSPDSDGYAEAWVTPNGVTGPTPLGTRPITVGGTQTHHYPNSQDAALAWYHDHALGITRLNVYAGGAGGYIITDTLETQYIANRQLPDLGTPIVIQDRMFYPDGRLAYPDLDAVAGGLIAQKGCNPWPVPDISTRPEYFGDVIVVNGKSWPFMEVEPAVYRFRFLNGCNSRVLDLSFAPPQAPTFAIVGTEGGFIPGPSDVRANLVIGGAERFDVMVDFSKFAGKTLTLQNKGAKKPFPGGTPPSPQTDGVVMQFRVVLPLTRPTLAAPPARWNPKDPASAGTVRRVLLYEGVDQFGRIQPLLGAVTGSGPAFLAVPKVWDEPITESPVSGHNEIWEIFNTTTDSHPIHIHEVLFKILDRQPIAFDPKLMAGICNMPLPNFPITVTGAPVAATGYETGFKDTALNPPGMVTRYAVDFSHATSGRFVWHCHILEHEDHEMMRPYDVL